MIRKLLKYTISAAILATTIQATPTFASPIKSKEIQEQINATQDQIDVFETKVQQLDNRISLAMEKSQKLNDQIKSQEGKIEDTKAEIEKAKESLEVHKQVYSERLKSIQLEGKQSLATYAEFLLSSNNISEFLTRFTAISQIMESDTDLLNGLNQKEQALKDAEEKLNNQYNSLKKSQNDLASEQKNIEEDKKEIQKALLATKDKLHNQQDQLAQQQKAEQEEKLAQERAKQEALKAQQQAQQRAQLARQKTRPSAHQVQQNSQKHSKVSSSPSASAPAAVAVSPANSGSASAVIAYAKQFLGVPYVWGGSTPSGFDCSGFTSYVFRNSVGINLPRVSRDQQNVGTRISPSQVQPGDLVFRGSPAYHVGIYIGGGQYIHAPQTGDVVKIANYNPSKFTSAARILP